MSASVPFPSRPEIETMLYDEAALLDEWRLDDWLALFLPAGTYEVPTTDAGSFASSQAQYFIADDAELLRVRVTRLKSKNAHAENPRSLTHRSITNVRVLPTDDDESSEGATEVPGLVRVQATFTVHRVRDRHVDPYLGWYDHLVAPTPEGLRFLRRRSVLAGDQLRHGSRLSFIL